MFKRFANFNGKSNVRIFTNIAILCWAQLAVGLSLSIMAPFYPSEALKRDVSITISGTVISAIYFANVVLTPLFGKYIEKFGSRTFLTLGLVFLGVGNGAIGTLEYVSQPTSFIVGSVVLRVLAAVGDSMASPATFALVARQVKQENQGKATAAIESFFGIGSLFGPSIGGIFYDVGGFKSPFFFLGGISLLIAILSVVVFQDGDQGEEQGEEQDDVDVAWCGVLRAPGVMMGVLGTIMAATAWQWYSAAIEVHFEQTFSFTSTKTGLVMMAFGLAYTLPTPVFGFLTDRGFSGMVSMVLGNIVIGLAFTFLGPVPPLDQIIDNYIWLYILCLIAQGKK